MDDYSTQLVCLGTFDKDDLVGLRKDLKRYGWRYEIDYYVTPMYPWRPKTLASYKDDDPVKYSMYVRTGDHAVMAKLIAKSPTF